MKEKIMLYLLKCKEDLFRIIAVGINNCHSRGERSGLTFIFLIFFGVQLLYNVVLISAVQQSESVIRIHVSTVFRVFAYIGHYRILSRPPCVIQ